MVRLVRQIAIEFLYRKHGATLAPESEAVQATMAFIWAISRESERSTLKTLARVSFPFWLVQTSPENSVLLGASSQESKTFSFTHEARLSEVRRTISNEVSEPKDVPPVVEKVLALMDEMTTEERSVQNLYAPDAVSEVGQHVTEMEPSHTPNRLEEVFNSQQALAESEAFQKIRDDLLARVGRMEELGTLVADNLQGQLKVLENIVTLEKRRWDERIRAMKSSTEIATHDLEVKKSSELYSLKEEYRRKLRAKTAEFARASTDIESYFSYLIDHVRETRAAIGQKKDDVESAVEEYQKLAKYLTDALPRFEEILEALNEKSAEVLEDAKNYQTALASKSDATAASVDSEIDQRMKRVQQLEKERQESEAELDALLERVKTSIDRIQGRIRKRLLEYQGEVLALQRNTVKNDTIRSLAPLTHLDIFFFVAEFTNGTYEVFPPALVPEDRFNLPVPFQAMNKSLDAFVRENIARLRRSDSTFESGFTKAVTNGNLFDEPETLSVIERGLRDLQMRQLFEEGTYERIHRSLKQCMSSSD